jgi:hypothetical protein
MSAATAPAVVALDVLDDPAYVAELRGWVRDLKPRRNPGEKGLIAVAGTLVFAGRPKDRQEAGRLMCDAMHYLRHHHRQHRPVKSALTHESFELYVRERTAISKTEATRVRVSRVKRALARYLLEPDPIEQILARASRRITDPEQLLQTYRHHRVPDEAWDALLAPLRADLIELGHRTSIRNMRNYLSPVLAFAQWRVANGESLDPQAMFRPAVLRTFLVQRARKPSKIEHGVSAYELRLTWAGRRIAGPVLFPPRNVLQFTGHRPETYSQERVDDALQMARAQPKAHVGASFEAYVHLAAGTAASRTIIRTVRGHDIKQDPTSGTVHLATGDLQIPVHRAHAARLFELAQAAGDGYLIMGHLKDRSGAFDEMYAQLKGKLRTARGEERARFSALRRFHLVRALDDSGLVAYLAAKGSATLNLDRALVEAVLAGRTPAHYLAEHQNVLLGRAPGTERDIRSTEGHA